MSNNRGLSHLGLYVYAFGSFAAGVFDLIWGILTPRINRLAWGDNIPGATVFAYITGVWMVAGAVALLGGGANEPAERRWPPFISSSCCSGCRDFIRRRTISGSGFLSTSACSAG